MGRTWEDHLIAASDGPAERRVRTEGFVSASAVKGKQKKVFCGWKRGIHRRRNIDGERKM
jgi:hypothetical protein